MFKSKLAARTVSLQTAVPCLDRVSELRGVESAGSDDIDLGQNVISLIELIDLGRKRGIKLCPKTLGWSRLLNVTAFTQVLLRLNNGNLVVALKNSEANPTAVVVSDPLYEGGKPFVLPAEPLSEAWAAGEALIVEPRQSKAARAVACLLWVLAVAGFITSGFFLLRALREGIGS